MNELENDVLGFDPNDLNVFNAPESKGGNFNNLIYKTKPEESKDDDGVYRSIIKVMYNPFNFKDSVVEQQSYAIHDAEGWLTVTSKLTDNDKSCPMFTAWKKCHYSEDPKLNRLAETKEKGGEGYFDKRFARYVTVQIIEDHNHPELEGKYMLWKMPASIWTIINAKQKPSAESKKAKIPVMDLLVGRAIELEVTPGPDDPQHPERKNREISYQTSTISDDIYTCTNPDKTPILTDEEQEVLDTYISAMSKVWKERDAEKRAELQKVVDTDENTAKLRKIYLRLIEVVKTFCPDVRKECGYKEWSDAIKKRVAKYIETVLAGNNPLTVSEAEKAEEVLNKIDEEKNEDKKDEEKNDENPSDVPPMEKEEDNDLPF